MTDEEELASEPTRDEIDRMEGPVLLEFGARWCGRSGPPAPGAPRCRGGRPCGRHAGGGGGAGGGRGRSFRVPLRRVVVVRGAGRAVWKVSGGEGAGVGEGHPERPTPPFPPPA